jgi:hypothetical protein
MMWTLLYSQSRSFSCSSIGVIIKEQYTRQRDNLIVLLHTKNLTDYQIPENENCHWHRDRCHTATTNTPSGDHFECFALNWGGRGKIAWIWIRWIKNSYWIDFQIWISFRSEIYKGNKQIYTTITCKIWNTSKLTKIWNITNEIFFSHNRTNKIPQTN